MTHVVYINDINVSVHLQCTCIFWRIWYTICIAVQFWLINRWSSLRSPSWSRSKGLADTKGNGSFSNLFEAMHVLSTHGPPVREDEKKNKKTDGINISMFTCFILLIVLLFWEWNNSILTWRCLNNALTKTYYLLHFDFNLFELTLK